MRPKIKACLLLVVMFGLGVLSGSAWQSYRASHAPAVHHAYASHRLRKLSRQLHLTSEQEKALRQILAKAHQRASEINEEVSWDLADIHHDAVKEIHQVLTPEQSREFDLIGRRSHRRRVRRSGSSQPAENSPDTVSDEPGANS